MPESASVNNSAFIRKLRISLLVFCFVCIALLSHCGGNTDSEINECILQSRDTLCSVLSCEIQNIRQILKNDSIPDPAPFFSFIDKAAETVSAAAKTSPAPDACVDAMIDIVYRRLGIKFNGAQNDIKGLLPHTVEINRNGSCLGISLIFLLIAEKSGFPLYGVVLPGHFFVRFAVDSNIRNIEPNLEGFFHPDQYYMEKYMIDEAGWYDLRNLSKGEVLGVFYYNLGNIYRKRDMFKPAVRCYRLSTGYFSGYAEAWGNMAITYEQAGRTDSARYAFGQALAARPDLPGLALNIGAFELRHRRFERALAAFRQGTEWFPDDAALYRGMSAAYQRLGKADSSRWALSSMQTHGQDAVSPQRPAVQLK